jgi:hypothetical protein
LKSKTSDTPQDILWRSDEIRRQSEISGKISANYSLTGIQKKVGKKTLKSIASLNSIHDRKMLENK